MFCYKGKKRVDKSLFAVLMGEATTELGCLMFVSDAFTVFFWFFFSGSKSSLHSQTKTTSV